MPVTSYPNWLKGTLPEWIAVALIGMLSWVAIQYYEDQKVFRREANARITLIEKQLAVVEVRLSLIQRP